MTSETKLMIGPFKDMSGYATLARAYARSLMLLPNNEFENNWILASNRYDSGSQTKLPAPMARAHTKQISNKVDTVVQITTPNEMRAKDGVRNIGICCWETDRIPHHWVIQLNAMSSIIVPCEANKDSFQRSGVKVPIHVIGVPVFKEDYVGEFEGFNIPGVDKDTTIFYNIAQWTHKKGIDAAIRSYFLAFQNNENVLLLLKGYVGMFNQKGDGNKLLSAISEIKNSMRLPRYPRIFIIDDVFDEDGIKRLHKTCDVYINTTRGEGWCIPALDAVMHGNELVTTYHTAMREWVNIKYTRIVESTLDSVHNMPHPDQFLYTALENWYEPNVHSGSIQMKLAFTLGKKNCDERYGEELMQKFSPEKTATLLKEVIYAKE